MIEHVKADGDDKIYRLHNLGFHERFWGSDQPPSPRAYAIGLQNRNRNASSQENAARNFALDVQEIPLQSKCSYSWRESIKPI